MTRPERIQRRFEAPLIVAALLVIPTLIIQESSLGEPWDTIAYVLNWTVWLTFLAELLVMLWVVPNRWEWVRRHATDVAVVVLTPPFLPASLQAIRVLRLARLLRLAPLIQYGPRVFSLEGLKYAGLLVFFVLIAGGTAFAQLEDQPSAWDGIWWAFTTMTTVGYGDIKPMTDEGRVLAMLVMVVGIGFLTMVIGAASERFIQRDLKTETHDIEAEVAQDLTPILSELRRLHQRLDAVEGLLRGQSDRPPVSRPEA